MLSVSWSRSWNFWLGKEDSSLWGEGAGGKGWRETGVIGWGDSGSSRGVYEIIHRLYIVVYGGI